MFSSSHVYLMNTEKKNSIDLQKGDRLFMKMAKGISMVQREQLAMKIFKRCFRFYQTKSALNVVKRTYVLKYYKEAQAMLVLNLTKLRVSSDSSLPLASMGLRTKGPIQISSLHFTRLHCQNKICTHPCSRLIFIVFCSLFGGFTEAIKQQLSQICLYPSNSKITFSYLTVTYLT